MVLVLVSITAWIGVVYLNNTGLTLSMAAWINVYLNNTVISMAAWIGVVYLNNTGLTLGLVLCK